MGSIRVYFAGTSLPFPNAHGAGFSNGGYPPTFVEQKQHTMSHKKSIEQLKREGNYRADKHKHREAEAGALLTELPPPPFALKREAAAVYRIEGQRLIGQKMLKETDLRTLAMYSVEASVYVSEMEAAQGEGITVELPNGISAASAHRKAAETALKNANALADKLGLSPAARHRIRGAGAFQDDTPKVSAILEMMKGGLRKNVV